MKLGALVWPQYTDWESLRDTGTRIDGLGYDSLWTWDHLYPIVGDPDGPMFEGYLTLASWAENTENVRLGLMVGANTFRNPGLVVKMITTLDHMSGGRMTSGSAARGSRPSTRRSGSSSARASASDSTGSTRRSS